MTIITHEQEDTPPPPPHPGAVVVGDEFALLLPFTPGTVLGSPYHGQPSTPGISSLVLANSWDGNESLEGLDTDARDPRWS